MDIKEILDDAIDSKASDIHIARGMPPMYRIGGALQPSSLAPLEFDETKTLILGMMNSEQKERMAEDKEIDFSYATKKGRFRVNAFNYNYGVVASIRVIPPAPPTMKEVYLPKIAYTLARLRRGLVLVTGPTNSGKSTTIAAMIDLINKERNAHIITIEDPIEFIFRNEKALVHQRAVNVHTNSYAAALRAVLRQDPDVLLVGEMRDLETMNACVTIAETGPLVFATLHTVDAAQSIERIVEVFPSYQQQQIRYQLSVTLKGIVSQQLVPRQDKPGQIAAREILVVTKGVQRLIRDGETHRIYEAIEQSRGLGMISMDQCLLAYHKKGFISREDCVSRSSVPEDMEARLGAMEEQGGE